MMTPYEVRLLLHYAVSNVEPDHPPIFQETVNGFMQLGLLRKIPEAELKHTEDAEYALTERGQRHVSAILATPVLAVGRADK